MFNLKAKNAFRILLSVFFIFTCCSHLEPVSRHPGSPLTGGSKPEKKYHFTSDWFSWKNAAWEDVLKPYKGKPGVHYLEIGLYEGRSAFWILENILTHPSARLTGIDIFPPDVEKRFYANLKISGFESRVTPIKGFSHQVLKQLDENTFDIIYIDGGHTADCVLADAVLSWPLLKEGGILIFDDYLWENKGYPPPMKPKVAIDSFITAYINHMEVIYRDYQIILKKRKNSDSHLFHIQQYAYDWFQKKLFRSETMEPVKISITERVFIERLIRSRKFGRFDYALDHEMFQNEIFKKLKNRLKLNPGEKISEK